MTDPEITDLGGGWSGPRYVPGPQPVRDTRVITPAGQPLFDDDRKFTSRDAEGVAALMGCRGERDEPEAEREAG